MIKDNKFKKTGFTLIETFVAISILSIAVLGPIGLLSRSISDGVFAKNNVTSFYLAQDSLELLFFEFGQANVSDFDSLVDRCSDWCVFSLDTITAAGEDRLDGITSVNYNEFLNLPPPEASRLRKDPVINFYGHSMSEPSIFYRLNKIEAVDYNNSNEAFGFVIRSVVGWMDGDIFRRTEISTFLTR